MPPGEEAFCPVIPSYGTVSGLHPVMRGTPWASSRFPASGLFLHLRGWGIAEVCGSQSGAQHSVASVCLASTDTLPSTVARAVRPMEVLPLDCWRRPRRPSKSLGAGRRVAITDGPQTSAIAGIQHFCRISTSSRGTGGLLLPRQPCH